MFQIGSKGVLIGLNGNMTKTYLWVNNEGNKLVASFNALTGKIEIAHNYF